MDQGIENNTDNSLAKLEQRFSHDGDDPPNTALQFGVASCLEQVLEAWGLVYLAYRRIDLIDPNTYRIHTSSQAPQPHSAVITGRIREVTASTLTCIRDTDAGLPLDHEYKPELDTLRAEGRCLTEIGLLADRRQQPARAADSLFMLIHYALDYAFRDGGTDAIIGVHPRHARFYRRAFGWEPYGSERTYAVVKNHPVVLLRLDREALDRADPLPRGLRYLIDYPVPQDMYDRRYDFAQDQVAASPIDAYLTRR